MIMPRATLVRQRLLVLFLAGLLLLFSPLALRFETLGRWQGIPILVLYLFFVWAAIIAVATWILSRSRS
jgi:Ca2+/Na+ antiporter